MIEAEGNLIEQLGEPFHQGSVQCLYPYAGDDTLMVAETGAGGSVFDVGTIFEVPGSDRCRALFRHVLFERLADPATWNRVHEAIGADRDLSQESRDLLLDGGVLATLREKGARTHHVGMLDGLSGALVQGAVPDVPSAFNVVRRFDVLRPQAVRIYGAQIYDYSVYANADGYVVPLEAIVRFGVTGASSIYKRSLSMEEKQKAQFFSELGVDGLDAWKMLSRPVLDFTSKYEPTDRPVTRQEAVNMSGLSPAEFSEMAQLAVLGAYVVRLMFADIGLQLWDLKWELACENGQLLFVDTVDTDSVRATCQVPVSGDAWLALHVNKQAVRDYYEIFHPEWVEGVAQAKAEAGGSGGDFHAILLEGQATGRFPATPQLDSVFVDLQAEKLGFVDAYLRGADAASAIADQLAWVCGKEVAYYEERGCYEALLARNCVD
jgi:phosphoribosylaminoimidazole-succinocarboxamide synthase